MKQDVAQLKSGFPSVSLRVSIDPMVPLMEVSTAAVDKLTAYYSQTMEETLYRAHSSIQELTPPNENPFLSEEAKALLDECGLIRAGTVVQAGTILASVIESQCGPRAGDDLPPDTERFRDDSTQAFPKAAGFTATSVEYLPKTQAKDKGIGTINIQLEYLHPLSIGDVLQLGTITIPVCGFFEQTDADIKVAPHLGKILGLTAGETKAVEVFVCSPPARHGIVARGTGYYSLITQVPLFAPSRNLVPIITPAHIHTLREASLHANLTELLTLKYTDRGNRGAVKAALANKGPYPKPGAPYAIHVVKSELTAIGFRAQFESMGDHLTMALKPMTDSERLDISSGHITKPETINYRTYKPMPEGLFCEAIFGPEVDALDITNVAVRSMDRAFRFGHIKLGFPVIAPHWRLPAPDGSPSILATYLGLSDQQLQHVMSFAEYVEIQDGQTLFVPTSNQASANASGAYSVALLIQEARRLNPALPDIAPLVIQNVLSVLPPDLRPLILLQNGNFATSDLNDHYRRVINRNNRLRKLLELKAPNQIILNEYRMLQQTVDALMDNENCRRPVLGSNNRPLRSLWGFLLPRLQDEVKCRCDFSARAHAIPAAFVDSHTTAIPESICKTLGIQEGDPLLLTRPSVVEAAAPVTILRARISTQPCIALPLEAYNHLFANHQIAPVCHVHRPLGPEARSEALAHMGEKLLAKTPQTPDWLDMPPAALTLSLITASLSGDKLPFASPHGIALVGPGIPNLTPIPSSVPVPSPWRTRPTKSP